LRGYTVAREAGCFRHGPPSDRFSFGYPIPFIQDPGTDNWQVVRFCTIPTPPLPPFLFSPSPPGYVHTFFFAPQTFLILPNFLSRECPSLRNSTYLIAYPQVLFSLACPPFSPERSKGLLGARLISPTPEVFFSFATDSQCLGFFFSVFFSKLVSDSVVFECTLVVFCFSPRMSSSTKHFTTDFRDNSSLVPLEHPRFQFVRPPPLSLPLFPLFSLAPRTRPIARFRQREPPRRLHKRGPLSMVPWPSQILRYVIVKTREFL